MPMASAPAAVMKSSTPRPSLGRLRQTVFIAASALRGLSVDLLADEAAGEQRADHLGRGAAAQRAGQRQHVAVGALRRRRRG